MRIGTLFSGAGGLDMAVQAVFGGDIVWHSEIDKAASKVLAYRFPGVPNLGDITKIDWDAVEPVDVLCGGFPCQDVSAAGKRAGIKDGTRSGLWAVFAEAIDALRPQWVVIENVRGLLSAAAHRTVEDAGDSLEPDTAGVGDGAGRPVLRAAGAVLGDLAERGYDAQWTTLAAASVGAPHRRERVFILASVADSNSQRRVSQELAGGMVAAQPSFDGHRPPLPGDAADSSGVGWDEGRPEGIVGGFDAAVSGDGDVALLPTPRSLDSTGVRGRTPNRSDQANYKAGRTLTDEVMLPPTPSACNANDGEGTETWLARREVVKARVKNGNGMGMPLSIAVQLLPTPTTQDGANNGGPSQFDRNTLPLNAEVMLIPTPNASDGSDGGQHPDKREGHSRQLIDYVLAPSQWGKYAPAIARWEELTRPAPAPTEPNKNGNPRLSAAFSEWLMGWPAGWVTDPAIGISRNDQLRIVGNGVCPQQAMAALRFLLSVSVAA